MNITAKTRKGVHHTEAVSSCFSPLLTAALVTCFLVLPLRAATFGKFTYYNEGKYITITDYPDSETGVVQIPEMIEGKPVTWINDSAFRDSGITGVIFPSGLVGMGSYAFSSCNRLKTVNITAGIHTISFEAFSLCSSLTSYSVHPENRSFSSAGGVLFNKTKTTLLGYPPGKSGAYAVPATVTTIGGFAFSSCVGLTELTIPKSVTSIDSGAFSGCTGMTRVDLASGVTTISNHAFSSCISLTRLTIPASVTFLGEFAFNNCQSLTEMTIPASVTDIRRGLFYACRSLTNIAVDSANPVYSSRNGVLFNKARYIIYEYPRGRQGSYKVPEGVQWLGEFAFATSTGLTSILLPSSLIYIGEIDYGPALFDFCSSLTSITVDSANPVFSSRNGVLFNKEKTTLCEYPRGRQGTYTVPDGVTHIGTHAFATSTGLVSILLPSSLNVIDEYAFTGCNALQQVIIPSNVYTIGSQAFFSCPLLELATFLGRSPINAGFMIFDGSAPGFSIRYIEGQFGFYITDIYGQPLGWKGYPTYAVPAIPEIAVQQPAGSDRADGTANIGFGSVAAGSSGASRTFHIINHGTANLNRLAITLDGEHPGNFGFTPLTTTSLAPGEKTTFKITFSPSDTGPRKARLHIRSNDADEDPFDINLTGMGVP